MGAGYKTAIPQYVDNKMLQLPYQLMGQVLQTKDKGVDDTYASIDAFGEMLKLKALEGDKEQAQELVKGYESQADELAAELAKDPLSYKKHLRKIKGLSRTLGKDMEEGKWGAIDSRYQEDVAYAKYLQELDNEKYDDEYKNLKLQRARANAGTIEFDANTGKYNQYNREDVYALEDLPGTIEGYIKGISPDVEKVGYDYETGEYTLTKFDGSTESIDDARIHNVIMNSLKADNNTFKALTDRASLGMSGYKELFDEEGNVQLLKNQHTQQVMSANGSSTSRNIYEYHDNKLGNAMQAMVDKYRKHDTSRSSHQKGKVGADARIAADLADKPTSVYIEEEQVFDNGLSNTEDLVAFGKSNYQAKANFITDVMQEAKEFLGADLTESQMTMIENGMFSEIFTTEDGYVHPKVREWNAKQKKYMSNDAIYNAYANNFINNTTAIEDDQLFANSVTGKEVVQINGKTYVKEHFDNYIAEKQKTVGTVQSGFVNTKRSEVKAIRSEVKALAEAGRVGFRLNDQSDPNTFAELLEEGAITIKNVANKSSNPAYLEKIKQMNEITAEIESGNLTGEEIKELKDERRGISFELTTMEDVTFDYMPGTDAMNFQVIEESILPENDYNNTGKLEFTAGGMVNGKPVKMNFLGVNSKSVAEYGQKHSKSHTIKRFNTTYKDIGEIEIPLTIKPNGTVTYSDKIKYIPASEEVVYYENNKKKTVSIHENHPVARLVYDKLID